MVRQDAPALSGGTAVESVEAQTGRVSLWLIATLVGGTLILASFLTDFFFDRSIRGFESSLKKD